MNVNNGNGNGNHSHEQGLRVHHLANLGGLIALAGLDLEPPDFLMGALLSIRTRSQELATRELGPRLEPEMLRARERVVRREQWTEIDRALQRKADVNRVVSYEQFRPHTEAARIRAQQEIDRLQFMSGLGLAQRIDDHTWKLGENHERELRDRQRAKDVIKTRAHERQRSIDDGRDRSREFRSERHG